MSIGRLQPWIGPYVIQESSNYCNPVVIENLVMEPSAPGQTAILGSWPRVESCAHPSIIIRNVVCQPSPWGFSFLNGIYLCNAWLACVNTFRFWGRPGMDPESEHAIVLAGNSIDVSLTDIRGSGMRTGLAVVDDCEGTRLTDFSFVGCLHGVAIMHAGSEPGFAASHGHINSTSAGIMLSGVHDFSIDDVLIYCGNYFNETATWPFFGALLERCQEGQFAGVRVSNLWHEEKTCIPYQAAATERITGGVSGPLEYHHLEL